ncbi:putative protein isoform X1 [Capsicum chacoense]|uniref:uncharacterized protein LOC107858626 isoform X1 n=1 Tax=Capsicum annuum TaxID=4072 RepID=UPI0007BFE1FF|nr:uncharacterized protein LOC107858626 isoform X1 [Capsicum annuum]
MMTVIRRRKKCTFSISLYTAVFDSIHGLLRCLDQRRRLAREEDQGLVDSGIGSRIRYASDPLKVVCLWRTRHGCNNILKSPSNIRSAKFLPSISDDFKLQRQMPRRVPFRPPTVNQRDKQCSPATTTLSFSSSQFFFLRRLLELNMMIF